MSYRIALVGFTLLWIATGCGGDKTDPLDPVKAKPVLTSVQVEPANVRLEWFGYPDVLLRARGLDQNGQEMENLTFSWTSSDTTVLKVGYLYGELWATGNGTATVTASASGVSGEANVVVQQVARAVMMERPQRFFLAGDTIRISATAVDAHYSGISGVPLTWTSSDSTVAAVDTTGLLRGIAPGPVTIEARLPDGSARDTVMLEVLSHYSPNWIHVGPFPRLESIGDTVSMEATAYDQNHQLMEDLVFAWHSTDTTVASVDANGLVRAKANGVTSIVASALGSSGELVIQVRQIPAVVTLTPPPDALHIGETLHITVLVTDARGVPLTDTRVVWSSAHPGIARVDTTGRVLGASPGSVVIRAAVAKYPERGIASDTTRASLELQVQSHPDFAVVGIAPDTLAPGMTATIAGNGFSPIAVENKVTVGGVPVTVTAATGSQLTVLLPPRDALGCRPTGEALVSVVTAGVTAAKLHPLRVARPLAPLAVGEYANLLAAEDVQCNELAHPDGSYLISVYNTSPTANAITSFQFRGAGESWITAAPRLVTATKAAPRPRGQAGVTGERRRAGDVHFTLLEKNRDLLRRLGPVRQQAAARASRALQTAAPPAVGTVLDFRVPNINTGDFCANFTPVQARVVYVGPKAVVLEDVAAPLAKQMDARYQMLGSLFDSSMFPILEQNFGDPLAMDPLLRNTGRIFMLFSPAVNALGNVGGFVTVGDFFDRSQCASSDGAEIFYAAVPTDPGSGYDGDTAENWYWWIRATVIHEAKHITSFAERVSRSASTLEESWLEEATAMLSEELWGRTRYFYRQHGNTGYRQSIYCEVRATWHECGNSPLVMLDHFAWLYDYTQSVTSLTPLGRTSASDATFYGSGWALLRWAVDNYGTSEAAFLRALTQETNLSGVRNLEARTGKSFAELLGPWSLSLYLDDYPFGYWVATPPELSQPSWNTRDIFRGLNTDFYAFPYEHPFTGWNVPFGSFTADVAQLRGGTAALFLLGGDRVNQQVLELRGSGGGAPPPSLRMAIVRLQ